jgi:hypothetical protein
MANLAAPPLISLPKSDSNTSTKSPLPQTFKAVTYKPSDTLRTPYPENTTFPLALTPSLPHTSIDDLVATIKILSSTGTIRSLLTQHAAIYFSNLGLPISISESQNITNTNK